MKDPRVIEIEFLADLDQNRPGEILPSAYAEKLGVPQRFFRDMVLNLFREGCLEGSDSIRPPHFTNPDSLRPDSWGTWERKLSLESLLNDAGLSAYINHKGRLRIWAQRDAVQRGRIKEKFGILWDRRHWDSDVTMQLAMVDKSTTSTVLFMDLDRFKPVNDKLGHSIGDEVMRTYFEVVVTHTTGIGEAYGWGGDEVVVLLTGVDAERADKIGDAISDAVAKQCSDHRELVKAGMKVSVSIGRHLFTGPQSPKQIADEADALMYEEKKRRKAD